MSKESTPESSVEDIRKHPIKKKLANFALKVLTGWVDHERFAGMTEGSIFDYRLCHPNEDSTGLVYRQAEAGRFIGYDFNRPKVFPVNNRRPTVRILGEGRLFGFILDEVKDSPSDEKTPTELLSIANIEHILSLDTHKPEDLVDQGFLDRLAYIDAYDKVGLASTYANELQNRGLATQNVYQVSPKGNTLFRLVPDGGSKKRKEEPQPSFSFLPGKLATRY